MTQHLSLTLPNFNFSTGTISLNSLSVYPLHPIGTDFPSSSVTSGHAHQFILLQGLN